MVDVLLCLDIENTCDSTRFHCICIFQGLWIRPDENSCFANLVKSKSSDKVCISHFDMAIDDESFVSISPDIVSLLSKFPFIVIGVLNLQGSAWFSLPYGSLLFIISN